MKKSIIVSVIITVPLIAGLIIGYALAPRQAEREGSNLKFDDLFARTAVYTSTQSKDSIDTGLYNQRQNAITRAVATASPAVVGINVIEVREYRYQNPWSRFFGDDPLFRHFFGDQVYRQPVKGLGSGFIISTDGYILTNDHVAGNATEILITLTNKEKYNAKIIGTDPVSDIALLKIDGNKFPYIPLGNSNDVIVGEWAIALGNPFGLFDISDKPTVTVGVVSAVGMNLSAGEGRYYRGMIQTDAAINQGNSGGPLLNSMGEVIGVNSVIYTPNQGNIGLGFAIPIDKVKEIVRELKETGKVERDLWTGLDVQTVDARVARYFGLSRAEGVIISDIRRQSPGEEAGLKPGDIILEVNGERVSDEGTLIAIIQESREGDVLKLKILREKRELNMNLKLKRQPS